MMTDRAGSSPLSRGIRALVRYPADTSGIIPALAGNTSVSRSSRPSNRDHPRSRGEYEARGVIAHDTYGSSPLSRGIHRFLGFGGCGRRIIPALAGNTTWRGQVGAAPQDHPRSRGEYIPALNFNVREEGSSPLSRGIPTGRPGQLLSLRIIPALAGNTVRDYMERCGGWDHPRSRGEYPAARRSVCVPWGSSPLSRGIQDPPSFCGFPERIIPALAGNTNRFRHRGRGPRDHPRSRGEYLLGDVGHYIEPGSSPLSRGIPANTTDREVSERIIPALAGNTGELAGGDVGGGDHPRSRGEYRRVGRW